MNNYATIDKLNLFPKLSEELKNIIDILSSIKLEYKFEVYLFGSFVKRKVKSSSDIDLLFLLDTNDNLDKKQLRDIRWYIEDMITDKFTDRDVDVKLYTKNTFNTVSNSALCFESMIMEYMVQLI